MHNTKTVEYKTFINSIYFRQNDISEFSEADPSRKKEILKSIIDISRWDEYEKDARKKARDLSTECKILSAAVEEYDSSAKDLAILVGKDQPWLNTQDFLDKIVEGLEGAMQKAA